MNKRILLTVLLIGGAVVLGLISYRVSAQTTIEHNILTLISQDNNIPPEQLTLLNLETLTLPLTGVSINTAKVRDTVSGVVYGLTLDQSGIEIDLAEAKKAENEAYIARYGRLEPELYDLLQTKDAGDLIEVGIWLKSPDISFPDRPAIPAAPSPLADGQAPLPMEIPDRAIIMNANEKTPEEIAAGLEAAWAEVAERTAAEAEFQAQQEVVYQENLQIISDQMVEVEAPILADLLARGYEPTYVSPYAPLVHYLLPKEVIQLINLRADVDIIYGPQEAFDMMDSAWPTQKGSNVTSWGYLGTGIKVAILEDSRIEFTNPYIPDGVTRDMSGLTDDHSAATAGIIASTHSTYRGIAPSVSLYSANAGSYSDAALSAAMDWSVSQGANIINNSWGGDDGVGNLNVHDRHLDYIVRNYWRTVTVSAGNTANGCGNGAGRVTSPGRGYNVITVGNYADQNTLTWISDAMDSCSSFVDPSTSIEKPEIAAVGSNITSTISASPWIADAGSGTSYSAPMVAGEAALIMQRLPSYINWPESIKALLMATALHNIEGNSRLSEMDGVGGADMAAAFHAGDTLSLVAGSYNSSSFPVEFSFYAFEGETVRVVLTWDSNPSTDLSIDPLQADLDLYILGPDDILVDSSTFAFNPFEIVEFSAPKTGTYTLRVEIWSFTGTNEYIGIAWWTGHKRLTNGISQIWGTPPISHDYYRFTPPAGNWHVVGQRNIASSDYDLILYQNSMFGNPSEHNYLLSSSMSGLMDYILVDANHASSTTYYPEVYPWAGTGNYVMEWGAYGSVSEGTYGTYSMGPFNVVRVWDVNTVAGVNLYYAIRPTSGNADLGMALYASNMADPSSYFQSMSASVKKADEYGVGSPETMNYLHSTTDRLGLVVYNNGAAVTTPFYLYIDSTSPTGSISINGGNTYTNTPSVSLNVSGSDAQTGVFQMRLSNNGSSWTAWEAYSSTKAWDLASVDGPKIVYVQLMNNAGMISSTISDTVILDRVAPTGSMSINSGATYTNNASVNITLSATDDRSGVVQMHLSNVGGSWEAWEPYATSRAWTMIGGGDGTKSVDVQYRDDAGNVSNVYSDSIILDTVAPSGTVSINGGNSYTSNTAVILTLAATDATSGLYRMRFSNDGSSWSGWEAYSATKSWALSTGDGTKTVFVQFQDNALNISGNFTDTIGLDTSPPNGTISINGGNTYTISPAVTLTLSATDAASGLNQMRLSNDGVTWIDWETYSPSKPWSLLTGDGTKTVYVRFKDNAGNMSGSFNDTIGLDMTSPTSIAFSPANVAALSFLVSWSGNDSSSGIADYDIQYRVGSAGIWIDWLTGTMSTAAVFGPVSPVSVEREQTYYFRVRAHDNAGNVEVYPGGDGDTQTYIEDAAVVYIPIVIK